ncbi:MAG TPA: hypothetical protein VMV07_02620 [Streptosporangiaceae bacterium]|nr:hypothetical protein [Streptosporangiaceae bacterium]
MTVPTQPGSVRAEESGRPGPAHAGSCGAAELLGAVGGALEARGLKVRYFTDNGHLMDVEAANPGDPGKGRISIGPDGYLIWERWGPAEGAASVNAIVDIVAYVLAVDAGPARPAREMSRRP